MRVAAERIIGSVKRVWKWVRKWLRAALGEALYGKCSAFAHAMLLRMRTVHAGLRRPLRGRGEDNDPLLSYARIRAHWFSQPTLPPIAADSPLHGFICIQGRNASDGERERCPTEHSSPA